MHPETIRPCSGTESDSDAMCAVTVYGKSAMKCEIAHHNHDLHIRTPTSAQTTGTDQHEFLFSPHFGKVIHFLHTMC